MASKPEGYEFDIAKLVITMHKFFGVESIPDILGLYDKHLEYRRQVFRSLSDFNSSNIDIDSLQDLKEILETNSILYSFCFDQYVLLPPLLSVLGYETIVLISTGLYKERDYFSQMKNNFAKNWKEEAKVHFLSNDTSSLLFKLRNAVKANYKIIIYVDGNKGNAKDNMSNVHFSKFKGQNVYFSGSLVKTMYFSARL
jgi:hypothetical protein